MHDAFWTYDIPLFDGVFPFYRTKPRPVRGKVHVSQEGYRLDPHERDLRPLTILRGTRSYVMLHPYVMEPLLTFTVGLYRKPKQFADQDSAIGDTFGKPRQEGIRDVQIGSMQAWYYQDDRVLELWECFLDSRFRTHPLVRDRNMQRLWRAVEAWLIGEFPQATRIVTPFNDPIAHSIKEYQTFLRSLGYAKVATSAFGKSIVRGELPHKGR